MTEEFEYIELADCKIILEFSFENFCKYPTKIRN